MDILKLYDDFNIAYQTEGHKHCRPGWVNIECPFCTGNPGLHLGYPLSGGVFRCWRCGQHYPKETLIELLNVEEKEAVQIIKKYSTGSFIFQQKHEVKKSPFKIPTNIIPLQKVHRQYLEDRNFDADTLEKEWKIQSTGMLSKLDNADYSYRLFIPIYWDKKMVSFQTRTHLKGVEPRYKACTKEREEIEHQSIIYRKNTPFKVGIGVEGVTDVWRFGVYSCGLFGIEYTPHQVRVISELYDRFFVCFDNEPTAQKQAKKLVKELLFRGVDAINIVLPFEGDPGQMEQKEANYFVKQLIS